MINEQDLLHKAKNGDDDAFRVLVDRTRDSVWSVACGLLTSGDLRSEAVQRGYIKAWQMLPQFEGKSSFKTWVVRIVINESLMLLREEQRLAIRYPIMGDVTDLGEAAFAEEFDSFTDEEHAEELSDELMRALCMIPESEQLVIRLFYMQGFSIQEVVATTGWSAVNTRVLLHRGRRSMRNALVVIRKKLNAAGGKDNV
jgi:RNA polymerase sigma factor (sigma-70 family)